MTRRERHLHIIDSFSDRDQRYHTSVLMGRHGFELFTDDAVERLASALVRGHRRQQKMNAHNRGIARAAQPESA